MKQELEQKTRRSILRGRNSGQAVVEYILMVSIAVGVCFILKGAFKSFSSFIDNYLGLYTECLMAHGELPTLGLDDSATFQGPNGDTGLKEHLSSGYSCNTAFKPFNLGEGRPPIANGTSSVSAGKSSSSSQQNETTSGGGSDQSSSRKKSSGDKDEVSNGNKSSSDVDQIGVSNRRRSADGIASGGNNKSRLIEDGSEGDEEGGVGNRRRPRQSRIIYRNRTPYKAITGDAADKILSKTSRSTVQRKPTTRSIAKAEGGTTPGPRSGLIQPPPEKPKVTEETQDEGWGFGKMLKWLLVIGMIVALIIFFGGQLLNYSNSDS